MDVSHHAQVKWREDLLCPMDSGSQAVMSHALVSRPVHEDWMS